MLKKILSLSLFILFSQTTAYSANKISDELTNVIEKFEKKFITKVKSISFVSSFDLLSSEINKTSSGNTKTDFYFLSSSHKDYIGDSYYKVISSKKDCSGDICNSGEFKVFGPIKVLHENHNLQSSKKVQSKLIDAMDLKVSFKRLEDDSSDKIYTVVKNKSSFRNDLLKNYIESLIQKRVINTSIVEANAKVPSLVSNFFEAIIKKI